MAESWAVRYRPKELNEICGQQSIIRILERQLETNQIKNCYLFCGPSGTGKTTTARAFAARINNGVGNPIEIDAASNSGVDNVRGIIKAAQERSIDTKYKIYIIDECHAMSNTAWQAFLKCIEEPPQFTIFIFCTTDPQKIPATILNRVQRFNVSKIPTELIRKRLEYICGQEGLTNYSEACEYISKISNGGARDAIATLEKCASYDTDLSIDNVLASLGSFSYDMLFDLINNIIDGKEAEVISILDQVYNAGSDLTMFIDNFISFCLDISKYSIFKTLAVTKLPSTLEDKLKFATNFDNAIKYYGYVLDKLLAIKTTIKNDTNVKDTLLVLFLQMTRCQ